MIINFKYRLYPSTKQQPLLQQQFFTANQTWNYALNIRQKELKNNETFCLFKELYKTTRKHLAERDIKAHSGIVQQTLRNFDNTLSSFFKRKNIQGFPRFKNSSIFEQSFEFKNQGIKITEEYFKILKMKIKWKYHRELPSKPKKIIVKRESDGKYFVIFSVKIEKKNIPKTGLNCAIDMNVNNLAIAESRGKVYLKTIEKLAKYDKNYMKLQKKLSRRYEKKSKSKNTKKLQKRLNKIHKKVRNVKEDFFHKVSKEIVKNFDLIRIEKLEKKKMKEEAKSRRLRRLISEVSWDSLVQKLKYKTERYGKVLEEINPAYSSQRCNICGYINRRNRKTQEKFECLKCGHKDNADCNAAKNILEYEKWFLEQKALWEARPTKSS